jgi:hypothetical protein
MSVGRVCAMRAARRAGFGVVACLALSCGNGADPGNDCTRRNDVAGFVLVSHGDTLCTQWQAQVTGRIASIPGGLVHGIQVTFLAPDHTDIPLANGCTVKSLQVSVADSTIAEITRDQGLRWYFNVQARNIGTTTLALSLRRSGQTDFTSQPIPIFTGAIR